MTITKEPTLSDTHYDVKQSIAAKGTMRWRVWVTSTLDGTEGSKSKWLSFACQ